MTPPPIGRRQKQLHNTKDEASSCDHNSRFHAAGYNDSIVSQNKSMPASTQVGHRKVRSDDVKVKGVFHV